MAFVNDMNNPHYVPELYPQNNNNQAAHVPVFNREAGRIENQNVRRDDNRGVPHNNANNEPLGDVPQTNDNHLSYYWITCLICNIANYFPSRPQYEFLRNWNHYQPYEHYQNNGLVPIRQSVAFRTNQHRAVPGMNDIDPQRPPPYSFTCWNCETFHQSISEEQYYAQPQPQPQHLQPRQYHERGHRVAMRKQETNRKAVQRATLKHHKEYRRVLIVIAIYRKWLAALTLRPLCNGQQRMALTLPIDLLEITAEEQNLKKKHTPEVDTTKWDYVSKAVFHEQLASSNVRQDSVKKHRHSHSQDICNALGLIQLLREALQNPSNIDNERKELLLKFTTFEKSMADRRVNDYPAFPSKEDLEELEYTLPNNDPIETLLQTFGNSFTGHPFQFKLPGAMRGRPPKH